MDKLLQNYINVMGYNPESWFVDECNQIYHSDRILQALNIKEYLSGKHAITLKPDEKFNNRIFKVRKIVLQYAKTIINFQTSFVLKNPVTLTSNNQELLNAFKNIYTKNRYHLTDYKILQNLIKFGEAFEYVYLDVDNSIKSKIIDNVDAYPVYDLNSNYIAFVEHYIVDNISYYNVFTQDEVVQYTNLGGELQEIGRFKNISGLPIHYKLVDELDRTRGRSDLQDYISILDAMEDLISKYTDAFYKFIQGVPVVTGQKLTIGRNGEGAINPDVVGYVLQLEQGSEFEFKQNKIDYNSFRTIYETLKQSLLDIACVPSVSMNAAEISNVSTTAIQMLYSLAEVKAFMHSMALKEGFYERWAQMKKLLQYLDESINTDGDIDCVFEYNLPLNASEVIANLKQLRDMNAISLETLLANAPYIYDVSSELERLRQENEQ